MSDITAEWARTKATTILNEKIKKEILDCESLIIEAVNENIMYCFHKSIHTLTRKELVKRGFTVKENNGGQREGSSIIISW